MLWPINSLTAIDGHDRQFFNKLLCSLVTSTLLVRCHHLIARKLAVLFGFNRGIRSFYTACRFDELSRGSVSCLLNASFEKRHHNATTRFFTPKSMTMASAGAIRGEYWPNRGVQWHIYTRSLDLPYWYWAMCPASYRLTHMAFKMARKAGACFSFVDFMSCITVARS
jgi:hypothetical protein